MYLVPRYEIGPYTLFLFCFLMVTSVPGFTQMKRSYIKQPALGIHFTLNQFDNPLSKPGDMPGSTKLGMGINYLRGIREHWDFSVMTSASFMNYVSHNGLLLGEGKLLLESDLSFTWKMFSDKHFITPFLTGGLGLSKYNRYYGGYSPVGTGLQMNFSDEVFLLLNAQYRIRVGGTVTNHTYWGIGVAGNIFRKNSQKERIVKNIDQTFVQTDTNRDDSEIDSENKCPDVPGTINTPGCADTDDDGIPDFADACPELSGLKKYNGCPIPDTDGDGMNDEEDSCITIAGVSEFNGCPVPDSDGDGLNDWEDDCPLLTGPRSNRGCPVVKESDKKEVSLNAENILFKIDSYELLPESSMPLTRIALILKSNPAYHLRIEGHTDNTGTVRHNQILSGQRASEVMMYLVNKAGIQKERLSAFGFGSGKPAANNATAGGRKQNRRVNLILFVNQ